MVLDRTNPQAGFTQVRFLAADIGGTYGRIALMRKIPGVKQVEILAYKVFKCAQFQTLSEMLLSFISTDVDVPVKHCVLACAGQLMGEEIVNDNLAWPIHLAHVRDALGLDDVLVLNDFEALAYALDDSFLGTSRHLCGPDKRTDGPILVIGPGTGLGAAVHVPSRGGGNFVLATEAGQMDFAPNSLRDREILAQLSPDGGYVPFELLVSGPGLMTIYTVLCTLAGRRQELGGAEAVTAAAVARSDPQAIEAIEIFCGALGSFAGNLAMAYMATGGVYLAGGFLSSMFELLKHGPFEERFLHGRSVRALLSQVPVKVMEHGRHGVLGAAQWYVQRAASTVYQECCIAAEDVVHEHRLASKLL